MSDQGPVVYGGRYELHRRLARGGMADVYLARDQLLDRPVAVKVLFSQYATDPAFVERFRREAQAAANLNHPNIVGVYDWGEEDGTYFIVMEYVNGRSLADVLRQEGTLLPARAADIGIDVAAALGFAHRNGVVHRDVKPGNVMLASDGQVKVTDFGIARAASAPEENLTQAGLVMGTATYFSPEQAQGKPVDPRSDVYSLGIVLYESVCGRPPFRGDDALAVAYQHVQEQPPPLRELKADIEPTLEAIIHKCIAKSTANRYPSAEDLRADLRRYREGNQITGAPAAPAPVPAPAPAPDATRAVPIAAPPGHDPGATGFDGGRTDGYDAGYGDADYGDTGYDDPGYRDRGYGDAGYGGPAYTDPGYGGGYNEPPRRNGAFVIILLLLLAVLGGVLFLLARSVGVIGGDDGGGDGELLAVPNVVGQMIDDASMALEDAGFVPSTTYVDDPEFDDGIVISQSPGGDEELAEGGTVELTVSNGEPVVAIPSVVDLTEAEARAELGDAGFNSIRTEQVFDGDVSVGRVASQDPAAGEDAPLSAEIVIRVSQGAEERAVPEVSGRSASEAEAILRNAEFNVSTESESSTSVERGIVIRTDPGFGTVLEKGATVTLVVSAGPEQVIVPSVIEKTEETATDELETAGFAVVVEDEFLSPGDPDIGRVLSQNPSGGERADRGSTVTIVVGRAPATTTTTTTTTTDPPLDVGD